MTIAKFLDGGAVTMTSSEIAELTGKLHAHVIRDIRAMLEALKDDPVLDHVREDKDARGYTENFHLNRELTETLITGYSIPLRHKVIRRLHDLEEQAARPMTQAQLIAASANLMVDMERRQTQTEQAVAGIETRVASVEQVRYLDSRPAGFESMTTIRERISLRHGMPPWVINAVMRDIPGAPLPFAMVRSKHADDGAQPYPIWPTADITRRFDRFAAECIFVTAERATHPDIQQGRFKLRPRNPV
ncbi:Rha family transcriptional regulator [Pseudomonas palleroniana]|uniref:Rha family transcriptional regulator n=1 Tax=Pseudomonas palleroniana TaxID=191390 RepID=UPI0018E6BBC3|nr:Rha family transcriptional regulator [Pseudomonas palleroniana]MBI6911676.1 Rha family transcriptional regulator [Pseudomonas palleroniana]